MLASAKQSKHMSSWMEVAPPLLLAPFPPPRRPGLETIAEEEEEECDPKAKELKTRP